MSSPSAAFKHPDTPHSSDIEPTPHLPPSPPLSPPKKRASLTVVDRLIGTLWLREAGLPAGDSDWQVYWLTNAEFKKFERRLKTHERLWGWYEDKVHYDWEPPQTVGKERAEEGGKGRYILRMPTRVHEGLSKFVEDAINERIVAVTRRLRGSEDEEEKSVGNELGKVKKWGSPTLELYAPELENSSQSTHSSAPSSDRVVRRSPDATFFHPAQSSLPTLVVEVSYSQRRKDLPRLAESYIVDSRHAIRCVVGLDIPYPQRRKQKKRAGQRATVSVWRPAVEKDESGEDVGTCSCHVDVEAFRGADGSAVDGALELRLADFLPRHIHTNLGVNIMDDEKITIPFSNLAEFLTSASATDSISTPTTTSTAPKRFRKRKRTPPEELSSGREEEYSKREGDEARKERSVDGEWVAKAARRNNDDGSDAVDVVERRRSLRRRTSGRGVGDAS